MALLFSVNNASPDLILTELFPFKNNAFGTLVNFDYLVRLMENYGFVLLNQSEYKQLDLPGSLGSFEEMYKFMNEEVKRKHSLKFKIGNSLFTIFFSFALLIFNKTKIALAKSST